MSSTHLLNIDLDVESDSPIARLVEALGDEVIVFRNDVVDGTHFGYLELSGMCGNLNSFDELLEGLCSLIEGLPQAAREQWDRSRRRVFNVGFEAGTEPGCHETEIPADFVRRIAALNGSIVVTIYPPSP